MGASFLKRALGAGVSVAAVSIVFNSPLVSGDGQAWAQAAGDTAALEEIVITARQRTETLKEAPIAVSAFTAETIEKAGITRAEDFIQLTPNVSFIQTTNVGETQVHIRGVIQPRDTEPPFAYVVDGVLVPNPNAFNQELVDVQQVEVIKGPIGSIYGRNAVGGAILVSTKKPGDKVEGAVTAGYEVEGKEYRVGGYVAGPVVKDKVFARLTAAYKDREGYYDNITLREKEDYFQEKLARGRVVIKASETVEVDLSVGVSHVEGPAFNFNNQTAGTPGFVRGVNTGDTSIPFVGNVRSFNEQDRVDVSGKIDWTTNAGTLTFTAAYHDLQEDMGGEGAVDLALFNFACTTRPCVTDFFSNASLYEGYGPTPRDGTQYQQRNQDDTSFELRFTSPGENRLRYIAGLYYIDFNREVVLNSAVDTGQGYVARQPLGDARNPIVSATWTDNQNQAYAVFGQLAYDITPDLEASMALRWDKEERESTNKTPAAFTLPGGSGLKRTADFSDLQPRVSLRWNANKDFSLYATYGEGFRSGGFNPLGSRRNIQTIDGLTNTTVQDAFGKETSKSYEAGFKATLLDNRLRFNAAAFMTQTENAHFFQFFPFSLSRVISIVDENEVRGFEADFTARVADHVDLFGGFGYLDSEIQKNRELLGTVGNKFPFTPDYSLTLGGQVTVPMAAGLDLVARAEYNRTGKMFFDTLNTPGTVRPEVGLVNARLGVEGDNWTATLWARNLFDERYNADAVVLVVPGFTVFNFVTKAAPRTWGVDLTYKF